MSSLGSLNGFTALTTLVLDHNRINSHVIFQRHPNLLTLWVNHNEEIKNLAVFMDQVTRAFPKLRTLSMMNCPAAPSYFNGKSKTENEEYRYKPGRRLVSIPPPSLLPSPHRILTAGGLPMVGSPGSTSSADCRPSSFSTTSRSRKPSATTHGESTGLRMGERRRHRHPDGAARGTATLRFSPPL